MTVMEGDSIVGHSITVWTIIVSCCASFVNEYFPQIRAAARDFFASFYRIHKTACSKLERAVRFLCYFHTDIQLKTFIHGMEVFKAAPHNSARDSSERFCSKIKFGKRRNTGCLSSFSNCNIGTKDPLMSADAIVRCCLNMKIIMRRDSVILSKSRNRFRQRRNLSD